MRRGPLNGWSLNHKTASSWRVTSPDLNAVHAIIQFPVFSIKLTTSESLESLPVLHHKFFPTDVHQDVCAHGMYQSIRTQVRKLSTCCSCNTLESLFGALVVSDLAKKKQDKKNLQGTWSQIWVFMRSCCWLNHVALASQPKVALHDTEPQTRKQCTGTPSFRSSSASLM